MIDWALNTHQVIFSMPALACQLQNNLPNLESSKSDQSSIPRKPLSHNPWIPTIFTQSMLLQLDRCGVPSKTLYTGYLLPILDTLITRSSSYSHAWH